MNGTTDIADPKIKSSILRKRYLVLCALAINGRSMKQTSMLNLPRHYWLLLNLLRLHLLVTEN